MSFSYVNVSQKLQFLADSDGNNTKDASYNYPNIKQTVDGLIYDRPTRATQLAAGFSSSYTKINYYLHQSQKWVPSLPATSAFSSEGLTLNDLSSIEITGDISGVASDNVWVTVYTEPKEDSNDAASWYRSRYNFTGQLLNGSSGPSLLVDLTGWETLNTETTRKSTDQSGNDTILAIALSTNSADENSYIFTLEQTELLLQNGESKTIDFKLNSLVNGGPHPSNVGVVTDEIIQSTNGLLALVSETEQTKLTNILENNNVEVSYVGEVRPLVKLTGETGDKYVVPEQYNLVIFIGDDGKVKEYRSVAPGTVVEFQSSIILAYSSGVDLVLTGLNDVQTMDLSAQVDVINQQTVSSDAVARVYVDLETFRNVFQFQTDASDIDTFKAASDIQYKTEVELLDASHNLNPMNAVVETGHTDSMAYDRDHLCIRHDFVRHIAKVVFNTEKAVDIIENETELLVNLMNLGNDTNTKILADISGANGLLENDDSDANLVKKLIDQLLALAPKRFSAGENDDTIYDTNEFQSVPFIKNDTIRFKYTVNPVDSIVVEGLPKPTSKVYEIVLHLTDDNEKLALNPEPADGDDNEIPASTNSNYYYSYRIPVEGETGGLIGSVLPL